MDDVPRRNVERFLEDALIIKKTLERNSPEAVFSRPELTTQDRQQVWQLPSQGPEYRFAITRLSREWKAVLRDPPAGVSVIPPEDPNLMVWNVVISTNSSLPTKPDGSQEADSNLMQVTLKFGKDYPSKPPTVKCVDQLQHPNVLSSGNISLDILDENQWTPKYDAKDILLAIRSMFIHQSP